MTTTTSDARGLDLTAASPAAAAAFDGAVDRLLEMRLDAADRLKATLAADPAMPMALCLKGYFGLLAASAAALPGATAAGAAAEARREAANPRERLHLDALGHWAAGRSAAAVDAWGAILRRWPRDLLALRLQHFLLFWTGRAADMRAATAAALPAWDADAPGRGFVLSMHGFGLEESGDLEGGERAGREGVERNPDDVWGVHAVAHALDTAGRLEEGEAWLRPPEGGWGDRAAIRGHLWWHAALFPLEAGRHDRALAIFDDAVRPGPRPFFMDLQNAAALLARLELRGVDVGDRWESLRPHALARVEDHALPFTDLHNLMALARLGEGEAARALIASLERLAAGGGDLAADAAALVRPLLRPACEAILAFHEGRYGEAVDLLHPLRRELEPVGGSHTQRDVFHQLLLEAALRAGRSDQARELAAERVALRPRSVWNWQAYARALEGVGDGAAAASALARAGAAGRA